MYLRFILLLIVFITASSSFSEKRALLIGVGKYNREKTGWGTIHGDADVSLLAPLLRKQGFTVETLVNNQATKQNIVRKLKDFVKSTRQDDDIFLLFSLHGQLVKDFNGDEAGGFDQSLVAYDALRSGGYATLPSLYRGENHLLDDELATYLQSMRDKAGDGGLLFVAFDACYSRGLERGGEEEIPEDIPEFMRGTDKLFTTSDLSYLRSIPPPPPFLPGCQMTIVSAAAENERNFEVKIGKHYYGSLSYCIALLLKRDTPISKWTDYFQSGQYKSSGCFKPYQHPSITIYR